MWFGLDTMCSVVLIIALNEVYSNDYSIDAVPHATTTYMARALYALLPLYYVFKWKNFPRYWPFVRGIHWSPVNSPHKGHAVTRNFAVIFDLRLIKRLSKQSRRRWFETLSRWLWRHCNAKVTLKLCLTGPWCTECADLRWISRKKTIKVERKVVSSV